MSLTMQTRKSVFEKTKSEFGPITNTAEMLSFMVSQLNKNLAKNSRDGKTPATVAYLKFSGKYDTMVRNTHNSPIGEPTNWARKPELPTFYPGFRGRMWIIYSRDPDGFGSDYLSNTGLNGGTGGYGTYSECFSSSQDYMIEDEAFRRYENLIRKTRGAIRYATPAKMQFYPKEVNRLRMLYPLSWDSCLFLADFDEVLGKMITYMQMNGENKMQINISYASDEFIQDTQELEKNYDMIFSGHLPPNRNFTLDGGPHK